ncbi:uncharacterized protein G2W53_002861 [Senna tora]|uniref:Uncharacterized protein n=1 Tax=Senna tora TaxID=362788 RepID=A0A834X800_9FABA|nr:uncharacterized protein G2W53_002861 [Senna tora]
MNDFTRSDKSALELSGECSLPLLSHSLTRATSASNAAATRSNLTGILAAIVIITITQISLTISF